MDNFFRALAGQQDGGWGLARVGTVTSSNPALGLVKVSIQPDGGVAADDGPMESGWLPTVQLGTGATSGFYTPLVPGQQVLIVHDSGDSEHGIVVGTLPSSQEPPPVVANKIGSKGTLQTATAPPVAGEMVLVHSSGSVLRLCADGSIYSRGQWFHDGSFTANGDVTDQHGSLDRLRVAYDAHRHPGVQSGGATTGLTDHNDPE